MVVKIATMDAIWLVLVVDPPLQLHTVHTVVVGVAIILLLLDYYVYNSIHNYYTHYIYVCVYIYMHFYV